MFSPIGHVPWYTCDLSGILICTSQFYCIYRLTFYVKDVCIYWDMYALYNRHRAGLPGGSWYGIALSMLLMGAYMALAAFQCIRHMPAVWIGSAICKWDVHWGFEVCLTGQCIACCTKCFRALGSPATQSALELPHHHCHFAGLHHDPSSHSLTVAYSPPKYQSRTANDSLSEDLHCTGNSCHRVTGHLYLTVCQYAHHQLGSRIKVISL